jgi:hypothetical protein
MGILTIFIIIISWCLIVFAPAAKLAYEDRLIISAKKRGVSIFPGLPVMPIFAIVLMYVSNYFYYPIGTYVFLSVHTLLLFFSAVYIMYWTLKLKKHSKNNSGYIGFWVFNIANFLICLAIIAGIPYLFWKIGAHWLWILISAIAGFFGTGLLAERILFKLSWAEHMFGALRDPAGKSVDLRTLKEHTAQEGKEYHEKKMGGRTKGRYIDFKDLMTQVGMVEAPKLVNLDKKEFTFEEQDPGIAQEDLFRLITKGRPKRNLKKYHIDEKGIRIIPRYGPEIYFMYAEIEKIVLQFEDSSLYQVGGKTYGIFLPYDADYFVIRNYKKLRELQYTETLEAGGEVPVGRNKKKEKVYLSSKGIRSGNVFIPLAELRQVTIRKYGTRIDFTAKSRYSFSLVLDPSLPEKDVILYLIRKMVMPRAIPQTDSKYAAGAINRRKTNKISAMLAVASFISFMVCGYFVINGISALSWTETRGIVLSSEARYTYNYEESFDDYELMISYQYTVNGENYIGDRFKFGRKTFYFEKSALRLAGEYHEGKEIPVYYDPGNPEQAVLEWGLGYDFYIFLVLAIICLSGAVFYRFNTYRYAEENRKRFQENDYRNY